MYQKAKVKRMIKNIEQIFEEHFGKAQIRVMSPGRINLIGEHTDYNDGFVLPATINLGIYFACGHNRLNKYRFFSHDLNSSYETSVNEIQKCDKSWANYLLGVVAQFKKAGKNVNGFDCVFGGDLPIGIGMSSSASLETGLAYAINQMENFGFSTIDLVRFSQKAEHEYAGVQCGIMDQFAIMYGRKQKAIKLDCRSLDYDYYTLNTNDYQVVLVETGVDHSLKESAYNDRRNECEAGVKILQQFDPEINALRDASPELIRQLRGAFDPIIYKRCLYVVEENQRVEKACKALSDHNFIDLGKLMYASHEGLRDLFEVSCTELDTLVELANNTDGVLGARMMGGGFGGCTINIVKKNAMAQFEKTICENYKTPAGQPPRIIKCNIEEGTHTVFP